MFVVAYSSNRRDESPFLDMKTLMLPDKMGKNGDWNPIFKRNCNKLAVIGENWHSLVTIRGSLSEVSNANINEIQVCGQRCPVHELRNVCRMGNKTVVDLVVAIDPTGIKKIDTTDAKSTCWECDISFPVGFTPMCYVTKKSKFQYLGILFHQMGIMAVDVSPVSYTLLWDIPEPCSVIINSRKIATRQLHKMEVLNAIPSKTSKIKVCSETSDNFADVSVQTLNITEANMMNFYRSRRRKNDVYDLSGVKYDTVKYLRSNNILGSGHKVNVTPTSSKRNPPSMLTSVVISGETVPLSTGSSFYVIPDFQSDNDQFICLEDEENMTSHVIEFDKSESYVKYMDKVYPHGSSFHVNSQLVSVVSGSIILVVREDTDPAPFPGGDTYASQILSAGDLVVRDLVIRSSSQVVEKVSGDTTYGKNSFFVHDSTAGTTKEVSRVSHGLDDAGETGSVSIDLLYTDSLAVESIVNTFTTDPSSTTITSRDDTETTTATFDSGGLSFDSDSGAIYFGAGKEFRIQYTDAIGLDPSMLKIESLSGTDYLTRFLITNEPP